jgi:hypothetical protein
MHLGKVANLAKVSKAASVGDVATFDISPATTTPTTSRRRASPSS